MVDCSKIDLRRKRLPYCIQRKNHSSFDANLNLLLIRMPALLPHESAAHVFNEIFLDAVQPTGLKYRLQLLGSTTFCGPNGSPRWLPPRSREWPSVVIEVSCSESGLENEAKLGTDVLLFFS